MPPRTLSVGPFRSKHGLVDATFDGADLTLTSYGSPLDLLDRYRLVVLAFAVVFGLATAYVDGVLAWIFGIIALVLLAALLLLVVIELVATVIGAGALVFSLFSAKGRAELVRTFRGVRSNHSGVKMIIPEPDITLMDPVYGAFRVRLKLYTRHGDVTLAGWPWRRSQLEKLQRALAR